MKGAFSYFKSEWSFSHVKVGERSVYVDFNSDSSDIIIYVKHGKIYRAMFVSNPKTKKNEFKLISKTYLIEGLTK